MFFSSRLPCKFIVYISTMNFKNLFTPLFTLLFLFLLVLPKSTIGQAPVSQPASSRHALFAELSPTDLISFNYEYQFIQQKWIAASATVGIPFGYREREVANTPQAEYLSFRTGTSALLGRYRLKGEMGMVYNLAVRPAERNRYLDEHEFESQWIPHLGLRYQKPGGGFWMRTGIGMDLRVESLDIPARVYLGMGVALPGEPLKRTDSGKGKRGIVWGPSISWAGNPIASQTYESYSAWNTSFWNLTGKRKLRFSGSVGGFVRVPILPKLYLQAQVDYHQIGTAIENNYGNSSGYPSDFLPYYDHDYTFRYHLGMLSLSPMLRFETGERIRFFMAGGPDLSLLIWGKESWAGTYTSQIVRSIPSATAQVEESQPVEAGQVQLSTRFQFGVNLPYKSRNLDVGFEIFPGQYDTGGISSLRFRRFGLFAAYGFKKK